MAFFNPFCSQEAISYSNYCTLKYSSYASHNSVSGRMRQLTDRVATKLVSLVTEIRNTGQFLGIKLRKQSCKFGVYPQLGSTEATAGLCRDLARFLHDLKAHENTEAAFVAVFTTPAKLTKTAFEEKVAQQTALLQKAAEPYYCSTASEKHKQQQEENSISFGGSTLKVVATQPHYSQHPHCLGYPMLAFSLVAEH